MNISLITVNLGAISHMQSQPSLNTKTLFEFIEVLQLAQTKYSRSFKYAMISPV